MPTTKYWPEDAKSVPERPLQAYKEHDINWKLGTDSTEERVMWKYMTRFIFFHRRNVFRLLRVL